MATIPESPGCPQGQPRNHPQSRSQSRPQSRLQKRHRPTTGKVCSTFSPELFNSEHRPTAGKVCSPAAVATANNAQNTQIENTQRKMHKVHKENPENPRDIEEPLHRNPRGIEELLHRNPRLWRGCDMAGQGCHGRSSGFPAWTRFFPDAAGPGAGLSKSSAPIGAWVSCNC